LNRISRHVLYILPGALGHLKSLKRRDNMADFYPWSLVMPFVFFATLIGIVWLLTEIIHRVKRREMRKKGVLALMIFTATLAGVGVVLMVKSFPVLQEAAGWLLAVATIASIYLIYKEAKAKGKEVLL